MKDWESSLTNILFNPRISEKDKKIFNSLPQKGNFASHVWIATSGTSGHTKFVALSKEAMLISANAVNKHLNSSSSDIWMLAIPNFHVGGLAIWARAFLSGAKVIDLKPQQEKWDPYLFWNGVKNSKVTLTSLVPTQIYDLVSKQLPAPSFLKAVIVGGGGLSLSLYNQAAQLGWKLLLSYGLTECASQVATTTGKEEEFGYGSLLSHIEIKTDSEGYICLKSPSLLTAYGFVQNNIIQINDPKQNGWFKTEDKGELRGNALKVHGRSSDFVKIGGESCSLIRLRAILEDLKRTQNFSFEIVITAKPDERLGQVIHLYTEENSLSLIEDLVKQFNAVVLPFERIRKINIVKKIPYSPLGKILYGKL
jgi:O-succinylbenzoic acid--CoA ligase